jgi:type II secretory pathway pseudopilin PulG
VTGIDVALIIFALIALALAAGIVAFSRRQRRGARRLVGQRVVLQTKDDRSLRGVLVGVYADCVAIGHFEYLEEANPVDLPGEATVLHSNLSWIHKLGPGD